MSKKALDRIRKNIETREETLDLSKCKMNELPEELRQCVWLKELNFEENKVVDLSLLADLPNLVMLNFGNNQITDLSPLSNLSNLILLYCWSNQITDLSPLSSLSNLAILNFGANQIKDLSPLSNLSNLNKILCWGNQITDLSPLSSLLNLAGLNLGGNQVTDLSPLSSLSNLVYLTCRSNQLTDLSTLSNLSNLAILDCGHNQITDLAPILFLIRNRLKVVYDPDITVYDTDLTMLNILNFSLGTLNNSFDILRDFSTNTKLEGRINVRGCPITTPPIEIVKQGNDAIIRYFDQLHQAAPLNEVKILLVGEGAAGKTSLVKALCQDTFDKKESQTHGIRIRRLEQKIGVDKVKLHFWDFGGQEIMHATHQFFLSKRSIYLLVLDSRRDEKAEYWLKHIESFGGDSPILVILNKMDENPGFRVNERFLQDRYPNIRGFYKVSCSKRKIGLKELKDALEKEINALELRKTMFPKTWFDVKNEFDNTKKDFISGEQFRNICVKYQVADEVDQDILLRLLNDLGKVLHYDSLRLHNTEVLNPLWLTNGVYRVINSPIVVKQKGWFEESELEAIIEDDRYQKNNPDLLNNLKEFFSKAGKVDNYRFPRDKYAFLIGMMQEFELCYQLSDAKKGYIVPELLPVEEQSYTFSNHAAVLYFVFEYPEFLPTSIFPRLMVRLNDYIFEDRKWRTGMTLSGGAVFDAIANVIADREAKRLIIKISGVDARRFLALIRQSVRSINAGFQKLNWDELVPLPDRDKMGKEVFVKYEELIGLEEMEVDDFVSGELKKKYRVKDLLNGIEETRQDTVKPIRLFIAYSKLDQTHKENLLKHLSGLRKENIITWHDNDVLPGEDWDDRIKTELLKSDILLYLVSAHSMATEYIQNVELRLIEQRVKRNECTLVPVIVDFCHWTDLDFAKHQALPEQGIPISNAKHWVNGHEAWLNAIEGIKKLIGSLR